MVRIGLGLYIVDDNILSLTSCGLGGSGLHE